LEHLFFLSTVLPFRRWLWRWTCWMAVIILYHSCCSQTFIICNLLWNGSRMIYENSDGKPYGNCEVVVYEA